jgi:hypothetical protein
VKYGMLKEAVDEMTAGIKKLASELDIEVIDINAATSSHLEHFSFDGIHADASGAKHVAETVYAAMRAKAPGAQVLDGMTSSDQQDGERLRYSPRNEGGRFCTKA